MSSIGVPNRKTSWETFTVATHYREIGIPAATQQSIHLCGDGTFVGVISFESSNLDDVATTSTTSGEWVDETSTLADVTINGATRGAMVHIGNMSARRLRITIVCSTGGQMAIAANGKA